MSRDRREDRVEKQFDPDAWTPLTEVGAQVKAGTITDIDQILNKGQKIQESEIVDALMPDVKVELLMVGQAKGKFGGGQKRVFKQTQKKTNEGNKPSFATLAVAGNSNGYVGIGYKKSRETVPAREKAMRESKLNIIKIRRGSGSWESGGKTDNSVPFKVSGKCGSVIVTLIPAPAGTGLRIEKECATMLKLAGIENVWSRSEGQTKSKVNMLFACFEALKKLSSTKVLPKHYEVLGIKEGNKATAE